MQVAYGCVCTPLRKQQVSGQLFFVCAGRDSEAWILNIGFGRLGK